MLRRRLVNHCRLIGGALALAAIFAGEAAAATNGQWVIVDSGGPSETLLTLNPITRDDLPRGERVIYSAPANRRLDAPQWSPDGNRIVFAEDGSRILVYELASERVSEVASAAAAPSWSPDGARIAFVRAGQLVTRLTDGSGEQLLPIDAAGVRDVAWSPDGELLALWVGDRIDVVSADGAVREALGEHAAGGAAWAPDSGSFVYSRNLPGMEATVLQRVWTDSPGQGWMTYAWEPAGTDLEPDFSPRGTELVYSHRDAAGGPPALEVILPGALTGGGLRNDLVPSEADWQPCVAGVTTSCTSVMRPFGAPLPPSCPASTSITTVAGRRAVVPVACTGATRYEVVDPPAHGTVTAGFRVLGYQPSPAFSGEDTFTYRALDMFGNASAVSRVVVTVAPRPPRPAAPKLAVVGSPRLNRRGRVLLRGTCDRSCVVKLRLRVKLHTGRTVDGRSATASAPAGGTVSVRLTRGKVPARRRIVSVRVIGRLRGADGRERMFSLKVRR